MKFEITKVLASDRTVKISGTGKVDGTVAKYGVYTDKACKTRSARSLSARMEQAPFSYLKSSITLRRSPHRQVTVSLKKCSH